MQHGTYGAWMSVRSYFRHKVSQAKSSEALGGNKENFRQSSSMKPQKPNMEEMSSTGPLITTTTLPALTVAPQEPKIPRKRFIISPTLKLTILLHVTPTLRPESHTWKLTCLLNNLAPRRNPYLLSLPRMPFPIAHPPTC